MPSLTVNGIKADIEYPYTVSSWNKEYLPSTFLHTISPHRHNGRHIVYTYIHVSSTITSWK